MLKIIELPYLCMAYGTVNGKRVTLFARQYIDCFVMAADWMQLHGSSHVKVRVH